MSPQEAVRRITELVQDADREAALFRHPPLPIDVNELREIVKQVNAE